MNILKKKVHDGIKNLFLEIFGINFFFSKRFKLLNILFLTLSIKLRCSNKEKFHYTHLSVRKR